MTDSPPPTPPVVRRSMSGAQYTVYKQVFIFNCAHNLVVKERNTLTVRVRFKSVELPLLNAPVIRQYEEEPLVVFAANSTGQIHHY